jgi:hypothetical protein
VFTISNTIRNKEKAMMKHFRLFLPLFLILFCCPVPLLHGEVSRNPGTTFYRGSHLGRIPHPELSEMLADLEILKKQGVTPPIVPP